MYNNEIIYKELFLLAYNLKTSSLDRKNYLLPRESFRVGQYVKGELQQSWIGNEAYKKI